MPSLMKLILPALAAAGTAHAACSISATTTIQNAGDATALATCSTFSGSIAIATGTTDDIAFAGMKVLNGNLVATNNSNIKRIGANDLQQLNGDLKLDGLTRLTGLDFPQLKKVQSIIWNALPNLNDIGFTATVDEADVVDIQNTGLRSLGGISIQKAKTLKVANNGFINEIKMDLLGNVSTSLDFSDNNKAVQVSLAGMTWASNLTFRFCGSVSLPALQKLNGSLGLYNNGFESFAAPNLTEIGEALAIIGNEQLQNVSFPLVTKINDDIRYANNSALETVNLPLLKSVGGAFDISGNMTNVTTPKLDNVKGAFNIQSSENITDTCSFYNNLKSKKLIQGSFYCRGVLVNPSTEGTKPKDQSGGNKTSAATTLSAMNGALGLAAMAAVYLY